MADVKPVITQRW